MGSREIIYANRFENCPTGIRYQGGPSAGSYGYIYGNTFTNGAIAIMVSKVGTSVDVHHNLFNGMTSYGVQNTDTTSVNAQNNWWGSTNGPTGVRGSPASTNVVYANYWTTPTQNTQGVWNVFAQRKAGTMLVDIYYDLIGDAGHTYHVTIEASTSGGAPYTISPASQTLSGAVGNGVSPGENLHAVWDASTGGPYTDTSRVKVTADLE